MSSLAKFAFFALFKVLIKLFFSIDMVSTTPLKIFVSRNRQSLICRGRAKLSPHAAYQLGALKTGQLLRCQVRRACLQQVEKS
jgi:hypothetical protein